MDEKYIPELIKLYESGKSINEIARMYSTYPMTIHRILKKYVMLRHDTLKKGDIYVEGGEKLIEWAKAQGRLVTKKELATVIGKKKLSPAYFVKYPELGKYVVINAQEDLRKYLDVLYNWLTENNIPYKPNDRTAIKMNIDALLLGDYKNIAFQITEKPSQMSKKTHEKNISKKVARAREAGINLILLSKNDLEHLDDLKLTIEKIKH